MKPGRASEKEQEPFEGSFLGPPMSLVRRKVRLKLQGLQSMGGVRVLGMGVIKIVLGLGLGL